MVKIQLTDENRAEYSTLEAAVYVLDICVAIQKNGLT
jgi:hypothetical protein